MRLTRTEVHGLIYLLGLMTFAASVPLSNFMMSLAQWLLVANLIAGGRYPEKLKRLWKNKGALLIIAIFLMHAAGMIWSTDLDYALKDIRVKLPLLVLPFIMAAEPPLNYQRFRIVMLVHVLAVIAGSIFITSRVYTLGLADAREASVLISHIRFALNVCLAIFSLGYFVLRDGTIKPLFRALMAIPLTWLLAFLLILQSATGLVIFFFVCGAILIRELFIPSKKIYKIIAGSLLGLMVAVIVVWAGRFYLQNFSGNRIDYSKLEYFTPRGNPYAHNTDNLQRENGNYLWIYVCYEEMDSAWRTRSDIHPDSLGRSGEKVRYTLVRFLTSKGLRKDLDGVGQLTDEEVKAIEDGIPNMEELHKPGFLKRADRVLWELNDYIYVGDPRDRSLMQRVELWNIALQIAGEHPLIGVGTGDVPAAFEQELNEDHSAMRGEGLRTHNQYLAMAVAFGFPGMLLFLFAIFYAPIQSKQLWRYFFFAYFLIALISMLAEDTLESQAGVSFIIFFYALMLFAWKPKIPAGEETLRPIRFIDGKR